MSALHAHAQAADILARAFSQQSAECGDVGHGLLLARISAAHHHAAIAMREAIKAECEAVAAQPRPEFKTK